MVREAVDLCYYEAVNAIPDASSFAPETVARLAHYCHRTLPLEEIAGGRAALGYESLPLCVIDAVWSLNVGQAAVRAVVARYLEWAELSASAVQPLGEFVSVLRELGAERAAEEVFRNRQRTAFGAGSILKASGCR